MRPTLAILPLCLTLAAGFARAAAPDPDAILVGPAAASPAEKALIGGDTRVLAEFDFDHPTEGPDPEGWTVRDLTEQAGDFWHVEDFVDIASAFNAPISGSRSLWCGALRPYESFVGLTGYGNRWTQVFQTVQNLLHLAPTQDIVLQFQEKHRFGSGDKVELQLFTRSNRWHTLLTISGDAGVAVTARVATAPAESIAVAGAPIRFLMTSDHRISAEDGLTAGLGIVIDDLVATNGSFTLDTQDFESEADEARETVDGRWLAFGASGLVPFGIFAGLVDGDQVLQEGPTPQNDTGMWSFFYDSPDDYACGGHPEQLAIPYGRVPSTLITDHLDNAVISPWIPVATGIGGAPISGAFSVLRFEYDVYADNPISARVAWRERFRFRYAGGAGEWTETAGFYHTANGQPGRWLRLQVETSIPATAIDVQFGIEAVDRVGGVCHTHAPLLDNVRVSRHRPALVVTTTADAGAGSLREAITLANANPDTSYIAFDLNPGGPFAIAPITPLPDLTQPVVIDGFTQFGAQRNGNPLGLPSSADLRVELDGSALPANASGLVVRTAAAILGMAIYDCGNRGINVNNGQLTLEGCHLGTDASGMLARGNGGGGLQLVFADGSRIGGQEPGARNVISGNLGVGIDIQKSNDCEVYGNYIGVAADGATALGNDGDGIRIVNDASRNRIGAKPQSDCAARPESANIIAANGGNGVEVDDVGFETRNSILSNSIYQNAELGIDLGGQGVTLNDFHDNDGGANGQQNYPSISGATDSEIKFVLSSAPSSNYLVQFYRSEACNGSEYGEGEHLLGQVEVQTSANGSAGGFFSCALIPPASVITATATDQTGNTSEFARCVVSQNTSLGNDVSVSVPDASGALLAQLHFGQVTAFGNSFVTAGIVPSELPPANFQLGEPPLFYEITTTASFSSSLGVEVCVRYDEAALSGDEAEVRLLHFDAVAGWVDVTTSRDPDADMVCGLVTSLSPFAVATPAAPVGVDGTSAPARFALYDAVPNPFNPATTIRFDVPAGGAHVELAIFDAAGRRVRTLVDGPQPAGSGSLRWDGRDDRGRMVAAGVHFVRLRAGEFVSARKVVLLK